MSGSKPFTIAYLLPQYPSYSEVFIDNEIRALLAAGLDIIVLALKKAAPITGTSKVAITYDAHFLSPAKWIAHLYVVSRYPGRYFHTLIAECKARPLSWRNGLRLIRDFSTAVYFFRRMGRYDVRHIHAHFISWPTTIARILAGLSGRKFSCAAHAQDIYTTGADELALKLRQTAFVITCTRHNQEYLRGLTCMERLDSIIQVYHGLDLTKWTRLTPKHISPTPPHILCIGRLVEKKGHIYLLKAISLLKKENIQVTCELVGQGPLYPALNRFIHDTDIADRVKLVGAIAPAGIKAFYERADVFILPCIVAGDGDRDGLPNVLLEALAMEIPVITTATSAITELIEDNITGLIVTERSPASIVKALKALLAAPPYRERLIANGRKKVESFDIAASTSRLKRIFTEL